MLLQHLNSNKKAARRRQTTGSNINILLFELSITP
nr:MAG TPA: hypothetical protein [Caudoviricetes sp.]